MLWPLTEHRYALDWVAVVDPLVTLPLIAGTLIAWRKRAIRPAAIGLAAASIYLGLAAIQHERASAAQRELLAARGITDATNARVLPQLGAILCYRSLYLHDGRIYADAIRPNFFGGATVKPGASIQAVDVTDLRPFPASPETTHNFDDFAWFADGYVARMPDHPEILGDVRYTRTPESMQAIWGVQLEGANAPQWIMRVRIESIRTLMLDTFRPRGYVPIAQLPATP
jgi:inner membrane protein